MLTAITSEQQSRPITTSKPLPAIPVKAPSTTGFSDTESSFISTGGVSPIVKSVNQGQPELLVPTIDIHQIPSSCIIDETMDSRESSPSLVEEERVIVVEGTATSTSTSTTTSPIMKPALEPIRTLSSASLSDSFASLSEEFLSSLSFLNVPTTLNTISSKLVVATPVGSNTASTLTSQRSSPAKLDTADFVDSYSSKPEEETQQPQPSLKLSIAEQNIVDSLLTSDPAIASFLGKEDLALLNNMILERSDSGVEDVVVVGANKRSESLEMVLPEIPKVCGFDEQEILEEKPKSSPAKETVIKPMSSSNTSTTVKSTRLVDEKKAAMDEDEIPLFYVKAVIKDANNAKTTSRRPPPLPTSGPRESRHVVPDLRRHSTALPTSAAPVSSSSRHRRSMIVTSSNSNSSSSNTSPSSSTSPSVVSTQKHSRHHHHQLPPQPVTTSAPSSHQTSSSSRRPADMSEEQYRLFKLLGRHHPRSSATQVQVPEDTPSNNRKSTRSPSPADSILPSDSISITGESGVIPTVSNKEKEEEQQRVLYRDAAGSAVGLSTASVAPSHSNRSHHHHHQHHQSHSHSHRQHPSSRSSVYIPAGASQPHTQSHSHTHTTKPTKPHSSQSHRKSTLINFQPDELLTSTERSFQKELFAPVKEVQTQNPKHSSSKQGLLVAKVHTKGQSSGKGTWSCWEGGRMMAGGQG